MMCRILSMTRKHPIGFSLAYLEDRVPYSPDVIAGTPYPKNLQRSYQPLFIFNFLHFQFPGDKNGRKVTYV